MKNKSIVLFSGGLDSTVTLAQAVKKKMKPVALTFDYGQKAAARELEASAGLARFFKVPLKVIKIDWLKKMAPEALEHVWVPNRNGLFINIAAGLAEAWKIPVIYAGFNREEARNFPDNSREFVTAVNRCFKYSTLGKVRLQSFLINFNKTQIVRLALKLKVPLNLIWVCYKGGQKFCGICESCRRAKNALKKAGARQFLKRLFDA